MSEEDFINYLKRKPKHGGRYGTDWRERTADVLSENLLLRKRIYKKAINGDLESSEALRELHYELIRKFPDIPSRASLSKLFLRKTFLKIVEKFRKEHGYSKQTG